MKELHPRQAAVSAGVFPAALLTLLLALLLLTLACAVGSTGWHNPLAAWAQADSVVWSIRLPRAIGALLAGALLGLSGAIAQGLFRNPLADPYLLGSAAGASLLVALTMFAIAKGTAAYGTAAYLLTQAQSTVFGDGWWLRMGLTGAAFVGSVAAVALTLVLAGGAHNSLRLLLAGVVAGVMLGAATQLVMLLEPSVLQAMQGFMLGSTAFIGWTACAIMVAVLLPSLLLAVALAQVLDALMLGEATAQSLGMPLTALRTLLVLLLSLTTATAVAHTGLIAFVGLAAPHMARGLMRAGHRHLLWFSAAVGGLLLLTADIMARWLIAPQELAIGIITALAGGIYLLLLMHRQNRHPVGGI